MGEEPPIKNEFVWCIQIQFAIQCKRRTIRFALDYVSQCLQHIYRDQSSPNPKWITIKEVGLSFSLRTEISQENIVRKSVQVKLGYRNVSAY